MKKISEKMVFEGEWLSVHETLVESKNGASIVWESVRRKKSSVGVIIVARLMPSKRFILIRQFRPAVNGYVLSFPAGLAFGDPQHALVELKEETGYTGKIVAVSPVLKTGTSLIDDSGQIVYIEADEKSPENKNPVQALEPGEDISVCLVKKSEAVNFFLKEQRKGTYISSNLWYFFGLSEWIKE